MRQRRHMEVATANRFDTTQNTNRFDTTQNANGFAYIIKDFINLTNTFTSNKTTLSYMAKCYGTLHKTQDML